MLLVGVQVFQVCDLLLEISRAQGVIVCLFEPAVKSPRVWACQKNGEKKCVRVERIAGGLSDGCAIFP